MDHEEPKAARRRASLTAVAVPLLGLAAILASCTSSKTDDAPTLIGDALLDPNNCLPCHAEQVSRASRDPAR